MAADTPVLTYFGLPARAFVTRVCLRAAGVAFEDKRVTFAEWAPLKAAGCGLAITFHFRRQMMT